MLDLMRTMTKDAIGDVAIDNAWQVTRISANQLLIAPGEAWVSGLPFTNRFGKDQLVSGAVLSLGIVPVGVVASDDSTGRGKILTFNDGTTTPTNTYRIVISASEQLITDVQDPFLKNVNLTEDTAQKIRLEFKINIVPDSFQTNTPVPYTDQNSTAGSPTNFPNTGNSAAPNLSNQITVTPTSGGNGELLATNLISGDQGLDGRSVELTVRNDPGLGGGNPFPNGNTAQQAFTNAKLIDSNGSVFYVNTIFNDTVSTQLIIRIDQEVNQPVPEIVNTRPYTLIKSDVAVTDDVNGFPQGILYWPIAKTVWDATNQFVHESAITDLRTSVSEDSVFQNTIAERNTLTTVDGGTFSLASDGATLSWTSDIHIIGPNTSTQTISTGTQYLVSGGFLVYELDLDTTGVISKGTLAVTSTTSGTSISLSGSPSLASVSIGNIFVIGSQSAKIIAIDDVNKVLTLATSVSTTGSATIYLDSYAPNSYNITENTYVLAAQSGSFVFISDPLVLSAGLTGSLDNTNPELLGLNFTSANDSTSGSDVTLAFINSGVVRLTNGSLVSVAGIPAPTLNRVLILENKTGNTIAINNEDSGASASNRIQTGTGFNVFLDNNATITFIYDIISARWQLTEGTGSNSSSLVELIGGGTLTYTQTVGSPVTVDHLTGAASTAVVGTTQTMGGQSFVASITGTVDSFSLKIGTSPGFTATGNLIMTAYSNFVSGVGPSGSLGVSNPVPLSSLPAFSGGVPFQPFTFPTPFAVTSGQTYWMEVTVSGGSITVGQVEGIDQTPTSGPFLTFNNLISTNSTFQFTTTITPAITDNLSFTNSLFLEFAGLNYSDNTITTAQSPIVFPISGQHVAWVIPNLSSGGPNLTVNVSLLPAVPRNAVIVARVDADGSIIAGTSSRYEIGDSHPLYLSPPNTGGNKNYLSQIVTSQSSTPNTGNGNAETGTTAGWSLGTVGTLTNGLPTGTPTFGSGSSGNLSFIVVSSGQLAGNHSFSYASSAATTQGDMLASDPFYIDTEDQAKVLTFKQYFSVPTGASNGNFSGTSSNSFGIAVWDVTNSAWIPVTAAFGMTQTTGVGYITGEFQTNINTTQLRYVMYNANATTGAITLYLDDISVGPNTSTIGVVATDWQTYTPTTSGFGTVSGMYAQWRRIGQMMQIHVVMQAGTVTGSLAQIGLPFGTISSDNTQITIGGGERTNSAPSHFEVIGLAGASYLVFSTNRTLLNGTDFVNNETLDFFCEVSIAGWSSNVQMSSDTDTRVVAASIGGANVPSLPASTPTQTTGWVSNYDTHGGISGNSYVVPVTGYYEFSETGQFITVAGAQIQALLAVNGSPIITLARADSIGASGYVPFPGSYTVFCHAGDVLSLWAQSTHAGDTFSSFAINIRRLSGPSAIAASESVNGLFMDTSGAAISSPALFTFSTKVKDSHNTYSGGTLTIPVSGMYRFTAYISTNTTTLNPSQLFQVTILRNGTQIATDYVFGNNNAGASYIAKPSVSYPCLAGDLITVNAFASAATTAVTVAGYNNFFWERVGN